MYDGIVFHSADQGCQGRGGLVCPGLWQLGQVIQSNGDAYEDGRVGQDGNDADPIVDIDEYECIGAAKVAPRTRVREISRQKNQVHCEYQRAHHGYQEEYRIVAINILRENKISFDIYATVSSSTLELTRLLMYITT